MLAIRSMLRWNFASTLDEAWRQTPGRERFWPEELRMAGGYGLEVTPLPYLPLFGQRCLNAMFVLNLERAPDG